ncbi:hypothetical protein EP47_06905 [Legionella norrlandica]|uniref:Uncharacterized protein n=1 Tax=Legionella norrlandica TaxID=1498499 RepID=A0A0A2SPX6_9GAMM|nr:hypothetical protein EP47_06905 [Legionella norrlandica]
MNLKLREQEDFFKTMVGMNSHHRGARMIWPLLGKSFYPLSLLGLEKHLSSMQMEPMIFFRPDSHTQGLS